MEMELVMTRGSAPLGLELDMRCAYVFVTFGVELTDDHAGYGRSSLHAAKWEMMALDLTRDVAYSCEASMFVMSWCRVCIVGYTDVCKVVFHRHCCRVCAIFCVLVIPELYCIIWKGFKNILNNVRVKYHCKKCESLSS